MAADFCRVRSLFRAPCTVCTTNEAVNLRFSSQHRICHLQGCVLDIACHLYGTPGRTIYREALCRGILRPYLMGQIESHAIASLGHVINHHETIPCIPHLGNRTIFIANHLQSRDDIGGFVSSTALGGIGGELTHVAVIICIVTSKAAAFILQAQTAGNGIAGSV